MSVVMEKTCSLPSPVLGVGSLKYCVHACLCMMGTREMEWEGERLERDRDIRKTVTEKFIALAVEFLMLLPLPLCFNVLSEYSTYYL